MKISIIIPIYQVEKYIEDCLNSILCQRYDNYECLLIDDGSEDDSMNIAEKIIKDDHHFKVFHKENGGLSDTRNYGINKAQGDYLFFLDSDDLIRSDMLERCSIILEKEKPDILTFDLLYFYPDGRQEISKGGKERITSYAQDRNVIFLNNSANNKLFKTSFLKGKEFKKGLWYEDLYSVPVWLSQADKIVYEAEAFYLYRQRDNSISHTADKRIFDLFEALEHLEDSLNLKAEDLKQLYFDDILVMNTLRIKDFKDEQERLAYYQKNIALLTQHYPNWYKDALSGNYSLKQKIIFTLLHFKLFKLVDRIYHEN